MQLHYFLAVVLSLSLGSLPPSDQSQTHAFLFSTGVVVAWWAVCLLSARMVADLVKSQEVTVQTGSDWFYRQTFWLRWLSLALVALAIGGFGLGRTAQDDDLGMLIQATILLSPTLFLLTGLWLAEYYFATRLGWAERSFSSAMKSVWHDARASIAWLVIPVLLLIAAFDAVSFASRLGLTPPPFASILLTLGISVGLIVFALPRLIERFFPTEAVDPVQETWLRSIADSAGVRGCRFRRWKTRGLVFNAMIAGVAPGSRVMLLSDRLLDESTPKHLTMIVLHELAHARRRHVLLRMVSMIPAWACGAAFQTLLVRMLPESSLAAWAGCLGNLIAITLTFVTLRYLSYWIEFDADRVACELASRFAADPLRHGQSPASGFELLQTPQSIAEARQQLAGALIAVTQEDPAATRRSWLHPSVSERVARLSRFEPSFSGCQP